MFVFSIPFAIDVIVMLCYVMLCYVMLCYVMLCYYSTDLVRRTYLSFYKKPTSLLFITKKHPDEKVHMLITLRYRSSDDLARRSVRF